MNHTLKAMALAGTIFSLMAAGALAASTSADEGQAAGKATKQAGPASGMRAQGRSEGKERSANKVDEHRDKTSADPTKISSETDRSARIHRYSYNTGPDVSIHSRYHRHYVYNEPDSYLIYKRKHPHHVYGYAEPSVTIRSGHRHVYSERENTGGTYVSGRHHTGASVTARTETSVRAGGAHKERSSGGVKTENGQSKLSHTENGGAAGNANRENSSGHKQGSAEAGINKHGGSRQGS